MPEFENTYKQTNILILSKIIIILHMPADINKISFTYLYMILTTYQILSYHNS